MNIAVVGSGYVGLVSGTCFSEMGNKVTCVDIDPKKIEKLENGIIPIFEPGLESMVLKNVKNKNLLFTTN
jgi:UDPglucose 6-dehydrogenase